jgi:hypothetical protein
MSVPSRLDGSKNGIILNPKGFGLKTLKIRRSHKPPGASAYSQSCWLKGISSFVVPVATPNGIYIIEHARARQFLGVYSCVAASLSLCNM